MVENELLESSRFLRELDRRLAPDIQSEGPSVARVTEFKAPDMPTKSVADTQSRQSAKADTSGNLKTIKEQPAQQPLDDIAELILGLSYGQMIELCDAMWKGHPQKSPVTQERLPSLLHRWAMSRSSVAHRRNAA
jgi:hypothetical protein